MRLESPLNSLLAAARVASASVFHRWFGPPGARFALWHDNDGSEARAIFADGGGDAELRLEQAIGATFTGAVKEEDDGPFLVGRPIFGEENLVFVSGIVEGERTIEKTGIGLAGKREGRDAEEHDCRKKGACTIRDQGASEKGSRTHFGECSKKISGSAAAWLP